MVHTIQSNKQKIKSNNETFNAHNQRLNGWHCDWVIREQYKKIFIVERDLMVQERLLISKDLLDCVFAVCMTIVVWLFICYWCGRQQKQQSHLPWQRSMHKQWQQTIEEEQWIRITIKGGWWRKVFNLLKYIM